jgi:lysophospholipase L1-like esterase
MKTLINAVPRALCSLFICVTAVFAAQAADEQAGAKRFVFGSANTTAQPGTHVGAPGIYSNESGCGFEAGTKLDIHPGFVTAEQPFFFSVAVPEGNYRVTVTLGDPAGESNTTVKAELRRLLLENVQTAAGKFETRSFVVNVRTPDYPGGKVKLKSPRETTDEAWAWDDKLTLEFNGKRPCLSALEIEKTIVPTVFILGDSTVCDQSKEPYASWGQMLPRFFKPGVAVANHAESGETLRTSTGAHRIDKVLSLAKTGDYVFIQFGHNDMKSKDAGAVQSYKAALQKWAQQIKQKGATPVLITPMNRHSFQGNIVTNSLREYPEMVREAARAEDIALIDLNAMSKVMYEALGPEPSMQLFKHTANPKEFDGTHHSPYGAYELAKCVITGIRQSKLDLAVQIAGDVPTFDPGKPDPVADFKVPPSPGFTSQRPLGD